MTPGTAAADRTATAAPTISGIVVHWRNERELEALLAAWPGDPQFPLCVVDNSASTASLQASYPNVRWVLPDSNLGFGGGVNAGFEATRGRWRLLLNPDVVVTAEALTTLGDAAERSVQADPSVAMLAPRLVDQDEDGAPSASQFSWQLKPLPRRRHLLAQCMFLARPKGPATEPEDLAPVEQPAAGALLVRADAFEAVGGFHDIYYPAWFEDVDFAQRLSTAGFTGRYARQAEVKHVGGASVPSLGFGRFLRIYYRNLQRFARARGWWLVAATTPLIVAVAALLRTPLVLVRRPRAAPSRRVAMVAFVQLAMAALSGWRWEPSP